MYPEVQVDNRKVCKDTVKCRFKVDIINCLKKGNIKKTYIG